MPEILFFGILELGFFFGSLEPAPPKSWQFRPYLIKI
jgi:hypothetical protein